MYSTRQKILPPSVKWHVHMYTKCAILIKALKNNASTDFYSFFYF